MRPKQRILIVDDDADFVAAVATFLEAQGFEVLSAKDGREGARVAARTPPDLVVLDVMMGERTEGFFAAHEIRTLPGLQDTPIIVASAVYAAEPECRVPPDPSWSAREPPVCCLRIDLKNTV